MVRMKESFPEHLNSAPRALSRGLCTVWAPIEKRLALSTISLQVAQLTATTCGLHSCIMGAWLSMMIYRRPLMAIFSHAFKLVSNEETSSKNHIATHPGVSTSCGAGTFHDVKPWQLSLKWCIHQAAYTSAGLACQDE